MYTLVLVEDDYQIRNGLGHFFPWNTIGFELIKSFENGEKALQFLSVNEVDVVLTDIKMPVMDGLVLAKKLKAIKPNISIIFLSGYQDFDFARDAMEIGVKKYIVKSAKYDKLIEIFIQIRQQLDEQKMSSDTADNVFHDEKINDRVIKEIINYINYDLSDSSLKSLAEKVGINPVYLSRYFKEKTGMNFIDYLIKRKMEKAEDLLYSTNLPIVEISELVGYSNEKNFSRAFKKYHGVPPAEYRHAIY
jgi:Response regulator containing CheY-like receiver domain and AraC-type DNA-binding domain